MLIVLLWAATVAGLGSSLAFVSKTEREVVVKNINVTIHNNAENMFLTEADVQAYLASGGNQAVSGSYKNISIPALEKALNAHPAIENAEVAADIGGEIQVQVT